MRRRLLLILLLLVAGAIANVAVAWGVATYTDISRGSPRIIIGTSAKRIYDDWFDFDAAFEDVVRSPTHFRGAAHDRAVVHVAGVGYSSYWLRCEPSFGLAIALQTGLPMHALAGEMQMNRNNDDVVERHVDAIEVPNWIRRQRVDEHLPRCLPFRPIGPGFAINTVFYAVVLWLLFATPFALRRRRRIKRGLCPKCAYDLRGSDSGSCPECGAATQPRRGAGM